jgi:hypothetical protein
MKCNNCGAENGKYTTCWKCGQHFDIEPPTEQKVYPKVFLGFKDSRTPLSFIAKSGKLGGKNC